MIFQMNDNTFLFIIPLTPESHLTDLRRELQEVCFGALLNQSYLNWKALIIGAVKPSICNDERFIYIHREAIKEEKLQIATQYVRSNNLVFDYIIRLDDDDIFNPKILEKYKRSDADVIVDYNHWFIEWNSKQCSSQFRPWFPNTCIHKYKYALSEFGKLSKSDVKKLNDKTVLLENDHSRIHAFYIDKNVCFEKSTSIYLRVLNPDSITSFSSSSFNEYLKQFGVWNKKVPKDYSALFNFNGKKRISITIAHLKSLIYQKRAKKKFMGSFTNIKIR